MVGVRVKGKSVVRVFMCFVNGMFVSGCSMRHHTHHDCKAKMLPSGEVLIISLIDKPEYQQLLAGGPQTCGMRAGRVYLRPGETCGRHSTKKYEEMLVFLSGKGTVLIGEEESAFKVGKGEISYIPPETIHNVKNTGTEPLVYIYCVAPVQLSTEDHSEQREHRH